MNKFDLAVIGSGPAGQRAAIQGAKLGKRVAIIEKKTSVGGICVNTGTIPSKTLREAILYLSGYRERGVYGRSYAVKPQVTYADLMVRIHHVVRHEIEIIRGHLLKNGVEMIAGQASFLDANRISIAAQNSVTEIEAEKVVIACGTSAYRSDRVPFNNTNILDSDGLFDPNIGIEKLPRSIIVVGAGVIGTEYACMFSTLGVDVRLLDRRTELFRFVDEEICEALAYNMRNERVTMYMGKDFSDIRTGDGDKVITTLENGREIVSDMLLFCSGRAGASASLNLEAAGVKVGNRALIEVNERFETSTPGIYAAGDIIGFPSLASTSMEQGRRAGCNAFGAPCESYSELFPYGIYTIPEISMVGKTEADLLKEGEPYEVGLANYSEIAKGQILGNNPGILKLLFHQKTRKLLGVHIMGDGACELVHIGQAVMSFGGTIDYFVQTVFNYPTLAEAYKSAALNGINRLSGSTQAGPEA